MRLPQPKPIYDAHAERERNRTLELADRRNHKRGQDVEIGEARLILTAPNGTRYKLSVDNAGNVTTSAI